MAITQIDLKRQSQDATLNHEKLEADFLNGSDKDLTNGNNDATITGLRDGTAASQDASTVKQMEVAIAAALSGSGAMTYIGALNASNPLGPSLDGASKGDFWIITIPGTLDGIAFAVGDHLIANADIVDFSVDGSGKIDIVDNTESTDILRDSDVQNNLTTVATGDVLDASQGKVLKDTADALEIEVEAIKTGAGLNANGTYTPDAGSDYITGATSLKNADSLLDDQIKANADAITALSNDAFGEAPTVTNGSPTLAALSNIPVSTGTARVYLNGIRQFIGGSNDYTIVESTGVITFTSNLKTPKDVVLVDYRY